MLLDPLGAQIFRFEFQAKFPFGHFSRFKLKREFWAKGNLALLAISPANLPILEFPFKFPFLLRNPLGGQISRFGFLNSLSALFPVLAF